MADENKDTLVTGQTPKADEKPQEKTVAISKKQFDSLIEKMDKVLDENNSLRETVKMLEAVSDKARLAHFQEQKKGPIIKKARVSFWDDKPIIGWSKIKDEVGYLNGRLVVNQQIRIFIEEEVGKTPVAKDLEYLYWVQNVQAKEGEIKKKIENDGRVMYTVVMEDGREITLDIVFINAF